MYTLSMQASSFCQAPKARPHCARFGLSNLRTLRASQCSFSSGAHAYRISQHSQKSKITCRAGRRLNVQAVSVKPDNLTSCLSLLLLRLLSITNMLSSLLYLWLMLQVIPQLQGDATEQTPPDLPSYLFKERIVYLVSILTSNVGAVNVSSDFQNRRNNLLLLQGMSLVPAVTELILAELLYLQYDNPSRPVYMYINSAGVTVSFTMHWIELLLKVSLQLWMSPLHFVLSAVPLCKPFKGLGFDFAVLIAERWRKAGI